MSRQNKNRKSKIKIRRSNKFNKKCSKVFDLREKIINYYRYQYLLLSDAKQKAKHGNGLEILTPKQMLQTLPTALAQVKAGNVSENLLN